MTKFNSNSKKVTKRSTYQNSSLTMKLKEAPSYPVTTFFASVKQEKKWGNNSALEEWKMRKARIESSFCGEHYCWDLLNPSYPILPADKVEEEPVPVLSPPTAGKIEMQAKLKTIAAHVSLERDIARLRSCVSDPRAVSQQIDELRRSYEEQLVEIEASRAMLEFTSKREFNKNSLLKQTYDSKVKAAIRNFYVCFEKDILYEFYEELRAHRFRYVWHAICEKNEKKQNIPTTRVQELRNLVFNFKYDHSATMSENIHYFQSIADCLRLTKHLSNEEEKVFFRKGIASSSAHKKIQEIVKCDRNSMTYEALQKALCACYDTLVASGAIYSPNPDPIARLRSLKTAQGGSKEGAKVVVATNKVWQEISLNSCDYCEKNGLNGYKNHSTKHCFHLNPCRFCKGIHSGWNCKYNNAK